MEVAQKYACLFCLHKTLTEFDQDNLAQCPHCGQFTLRTELALPDLIDIISGYPHNIIDKDVPIRSIMQIFADRVFQLPVEALYQESFDFDCLQEESGSLISIWKDDHLLSPNETAHILNMSVDTAKRMAVQGDFPNARRTPSATQQSRWGIPLGDIHDYLLDIYDPPPFPDENIKKKLIQLLDLLAELGVQLELTVPPDLPYPSLLVDHFLITNERLRLMKRYDLVDFEIPEFPLPPILCPPRGYLLESNPEGFHPIAVLLDFIDEPLPIQAQRLADGVGLPGETFEFWFLEDDDVRFFPVQVGEPPPTETDFYDEDIQEYLSLLSEQTYQAAILQLLSLFPPSRTPFTLYGIVPYRTGRTKEVTELFELALPLEPPFSTDSPVMLWQEIRRLYPEGRYWLLIQTAPISDSSNPLADLLCLDTLLLAALDSLDNIAFKQLQQAAIDDNFYHDSDRMPPPFIRWIAGQNDLPMDPFDFGDLLEEVRAYHMEGQLGQTALLRLFRPSEGPFLLLGVVSHEENYETEEMDIEQFLAMMTIHEAAKPTTSPTELFDQFREHYPEGRYLLVIQTDAGVEGFLIENTQQMIVVDSELLEMGFASLGNQSFQAFWQEAQAQGLVSPDFDMHIPDSFRDAFPPDED